VIKFGSIVSLGMALLVLALTSSSPRTQSINLGDIAQFPKYIAEAWRIWRKGADEDEVQRRKDSVALLSADMIRIAATKRTLANFLKDHPLPPGACGGKSDQFKCEDPVYYERVQNGLVVRHEFEKLNHLISGLQYHLDDIDPTWQAKNPKLQSQLYGVGHGKGLAWERLDKHNVVALREWLYQEADELEGAVEEIKNNLPSP
jgi:hypothetical protein